MFHEMALKLYFMKCLERIVSQCILALKVLKSKKKKLALTFLYCLVQETLLDDS